MLQLDDSQIIGSGVDRIVYGHPENADLCIKIPRCNFNNDFEIKGTRDKLYYLLRGFRKEYFDYNYTDVLYAQMLQKKEKDNLIFKHLPFCEGFVETNHGKGVLWQRIRNFDGTDSITLRDCYFTPGLLGTDEKQLLWNALNDFFLWQIDNAVMLREMAFANTLVCRLEKEKIRLYHVDAIGCVDLFPLADYAEWFARLRIRSKVHRFRKQILKWLGPQAPS